MKHTKTKQHEAYQNKTTRSIPKQNKQLWHCKELSVTVQCFCCHRNYSVWTLKTWHLVWRPSSPSPRESTWSATTPYHKQKVRWLWVLPHCVCGWVCVCEWRARDSHFVWMCACVFVCGARCVYCYTPTCAWRVVFSCHCPLDARDAMAKAVYGRLFGWIVNKVNQLLAPEAEIDPSKMSEIGKKLAP